MQLPKKIITRSEEITAGFFKLLDQHISDILSGNVQQMYHIKDFAALLYIHPTHFSNTIKLTTGRSPCDFVEDRVTEEAKRLLQDTTISVSDICYKLTFNEPTNFTKFFKAMTGMTPRQYRKQLAKVENAVTV